MTRVIISVRVLAKLEESVADVAYNYLFAVSNNVDLANAKAVLATGILDKSAYLRMTDGHVVEDQDGFGAHTPKLTVRRLVALARLRCFGPNTVLVVPQDFGIVARVIVAAARRHGAAVAVLPDGILSSNPIRNHVGVKRFFQRLISKGLTLGRVAAPSNEFMGGSNPDLVLRWGSGWESSFRGGDSTRFADSGCPRIDRLAAIGPRSESGQRLLVCSQPLFIPRWSAHLVEEWYQFLTELWAQRPEGVEIRIRLHPAEHSYSIPYTVRSIVAEPAPLEEDLEWATAVAAPFSTVLLEAAAARRPVIALFRDEEMRSRIEAIPFFADPSVQKSVWSPSILFSVAATARPKRDLSKYVANVGSAASSAASEISMLNG